MINHFRQAGGCIALLGLCLTAPPVFADGLLDPSFSTDGKHRVDFDHVGNTDVDQAFGVAIQADGKVIVVGRADADAVPGFGPALAWARLTAAGAVDWSGIPLRPAGCTGEQRLTDVVVAGDGKIWAVGWCETATDVAGLLLRIDPANGNMLSTTVVEIASITGSHPTFLEAIAIAPDGKLVAAGTGVGANGTGFAIARFSALGVFDNSFDGNGKQMVEFPSGTVKGYDVVVQPDLKVVIVGVRDAAGPSATDSAVARLLGDDGALDPGFGVGGMSVFSYSNSGTFEDQFNAVDLQLDGKIVVAGSVNQSDDFGIAQNFLLARLLSSGLQDTTFHIAGDGSKVIAFDLGHDSEATDVAVQSDGKIVLSGFMEQDDLNVNFAVTRVLTPAANNAVFQDSTFATGGLGLQKIPFDVIAGGEDRGSAMALAGGKIVIVGEAEVSVDNVDFAVARLNLTLLFKDGFESGITTEWH